MAYAPKTMTTVAESEKLIDEIIHLRRAARVPRVAADVAPARERLEGQLGATLSRSRAARLLGVSQPALDRWIGLGEVPTVITPSGRAELPVQFVVEIRESIGEHSAGGEERHPLAAALHRRRRAAERMRRPAEARGRATRSSRSAAGHRTAERRSLAYHRVVAERLSEGLVEHARRCVDSLAGEGRIHPQYAERWRALLARPIPEVAAAITEDSQKALDLRQNTPFAGVLNEQERRRIIEAVR